MVVLVAQVQEDQYKKNLKQNRALARRVRNYQKRRKILRKDLQEKIGKNHMIVF